MLFVVVCCSLFVGRCLCSCVLCVVCGLLFVVIGLSSAVYYVMLM